MSFDTTRTPDYSPLVVHFTKSREMVRHDLIIEGDPLFEHRQASARDRLVSILSNRIIHHSPMNFIPTDRRAVCFTECIWEALRRLADS